MTNHPSLEGSKTHYIDAVAKQSRDCEIHPREAEQRITTIKQLYKESIELLRKGEYQPEDVIETFKILCNDLLGK